MGLPSDAMVFVVGCSVESPQRGFFGLIFADQGMILRRAPSFGVARFTFPMSVSRCRRWICVRALDAVVIVGGCSRGSLCRTSTG